MITSGLWTSIQDSGQFGVAHLGIPKSGVIDAYAFRYANTLLGNERNSAVIEMTFTGSSFEFFGQTQIVISGAQCEVQLNDKDVAEYQVIHIKPQDILKIGAFKTGSRVYLAIKGGFKTEPSFNSRSFYSPMTTQNKLKKGDSIPYSPVSVVSQDINASVKYQSDYLFESVIEVFKGPEFHLLSHEQQEQLFSNHFTISSSSNRMAYQFDELLDNSLTSILTSPVLPGTVQLTPSGKLIILMKDCQTTGGYPRILQISEQSLNILAQKQLHDKVTLKAIEF